MTVAAPAFATSSPVIYNRPSRSYVISRVNPLHISRSQRPAFIACASKHPDAGLTGKAGVTGTVCTNLFPIPILGGYGWFLTVYERNFASSVGPFVARVVNPYAINFEFRPGQSISSTDRSDKHATLNGIAAGNLNVQNTLKKLSSQKSIAYELRFFERGGSEFLSKRRNELHVLPSADSGDNSSPIWNDPAPTYRVVDKSESFEVREVYSGADEIPGNPPRLEWFAMNLFPLFPLAKYSAFVCVWRQHRDTSPVAIDKRGKQLRLRVVDALKLPDDVDTPPGEKFAVSAFSGSVSDGAIAKQHKILLDAIATSSVAATSNTDFRVVVDNKPNTFTPNRQNEIWVPIR